MAKNDNAHSLRMVNALRQEAGAEAAEQFAQAHPLSKSADIRKKHAWAQAACEFLEARFDEEALLRIRSACRCNDGKAIAEKLLHYRSAAPSLQAFVAAFNAGETFASLAYVSEGELLFRYPQCYCACVKRVPEHLSRTWCLCTLGNARQIFSAVFGPEVQVTLLESIKTGADRCTIRVTW